MVWQATQSPARARYSPRLTMSSSAARAAVVTNASAARACPNRRAVFPDHADVLLIYTRATSGGRALFPRCRDHASLVEIEIDRYSVNLCLLPRNPPFPGGARRKPGALVIGAGFGGLAAAVRLGARGYRRHRAGAARRARRPRLCPQAGRLHLRCRADHRHRAVPVRGALDAVRQAHERRRRSARDGPVLQDQVSRRRDLLLFRRSRRDARRDRAVLRPARPTDSTPS